MGQVYNLFGTGGRIMVPVETDSLKLGQKVLQAHKHQVGVVCEKGGPYSHGYTVIFDDGSESSGQQLDCLSPFTRISVVEGFVGADEVNRLIQLRDAKRVTDRWNQEEAARKKALEVERITQELREQYPWAIANNPSKNAKMELQRAWPGVKFSVRADHNSVRVNWTDGPSAKQVEEVLGKYENGSFNGMEDIHEYDHSAYGEAVSIVLGRFTYTFANRHYSNALIQKAIDRVAQQYTQAARPEVTVEAFRNGDLMSFTPFDKPTGNDHHWSFQSLINQELGKIGMMPKQGAK